MSVTISRPTIHISENLTPELRLEGQFLVLKLHAMRKLRIVELQGPKSLLRAYGAKMPSKFSTRWFADDAEVPLEAMEEVAFVNQVDFRWACDIPMAPGSSADISMPAKVAAVQPIDLGIVSVVYEYTRFFGLVHRKYCSTIAIGSRENRKVVEQERVA